MLVSPMLMAAVSIQAIDVKGVIIDKNTNEGLSYILAIRNWIDFINSGMKDISLLELEKEGNKNGTIPN